ncbi:hypothetical protein L7F22_038450 [Adiantum nelumboides]|nr:hypothetical protein [Adiantum nelumboides]
MASHALEVGKRAIVACFMMFYHALRPLECGSAITTSSVATEWIQERALEEVLSIKNNDIAKTLSLPHVKLHCSMLAKDAIKAVVKDFKSNKSVQNDA